MATACHSEDLQVLVVDDTIVYRKILRDIIAEIPGACVAATAVNGRVALTKLEMMHIDFVLLDVEMPEMDGLETMENIARLYPNLGVLMLSGANRSAAEMAVAAVERGAIDFLPKPSGDDAATNRAMLKAQLGAFLKSYSARLRLSSVTAGGRKAPPRQPRFGGAGGGTTPSATGRPTGTHTGTNTGQYTSRHTGNGVVAGQTEARRSELRKRARESMSIPLTLPPALQGPPPTTKRPQRIEAVVVGISTGGPQALQEFIPNLPGDLGVPVYVVQHMPPMFTASLAQSLDRRSRLSVVEGSDGLPVDKNVVYIAPGGHHMVLRRRTDESGALFIGLNDNPPENSCRPAADVLFRSVANIYRGSLLVLVMTGMGSDGALGVRAIKQHSAYCLTQSAETCVIYGMPRAVDESGLSDERIPLENLAARVSQIVRNPRTMK